MGACEARPDDGRPRILRVQRSSELKVKSVTWLLRSQLGQPAKNTTKHGWTNRWSYGPSGQSHKLRREYRLVIQTHFRWQLECAEKCRILPNIRYYFVLLRMRNYFSPKQYESMAMRRVNNMPIRQTFVLCYSPNPKPWKPLIFLNQQKKNSNEVSGHLPHLLHLLKMDWSPWFL